MANVTKQASTRFSIVRRSKGQPAVEKASLPTEWSYELAEEIVRDYVQRNFADKGMEQGIDREPTIHIGAVANALERKGIQTERGNINRLAYAEVISYNKKNLERELQNESWQQNRQQSNETEGRGNLM